MVAPLGRRFLEEKFTGKKDLFHSMNMKNCVRRKVRKHKKNKNRDKIVTLDISANFDNLNKMEAASLESKEKWKYQERGW